MLRAVCTPAQVQGLNESRLTIKGVERFKTLSPLGTFEQVLSYSPHHLVI